APPLAQDVLGVEAEVDRLVAQEALRVDGSGQVAVVARLERAQAPDPDLGLALGADQVDALALARGGQPVGQARAWIDGIVAIDAEALGRCASLVARRHRSVIPGLEAVVPTRRLAPEHDARIRAIEGPDVPARLELVDHACGPRISDLEA